MNLSRFLRDALMFVVGTAIGTMFAILVAYPEILATSRENTARIEANKEHINLLWDAHRIEHDQAAPEVEE